MKNKIFNPRQKFIVKEKGKFHQMDFIDISHITCSGYLSNINFINEEKAICVCKLLKELENELFEQGFFRANRNTLINLNNVESYQNKGKPQIKMLNNEVINISRRRLSEFIKRFRID